MTTLTAEPQSLTAGTGPPLLLEPRHWLAALAILFVFFAPYQTLVQTVITDDAVRLGIEADEYDMTWVTVAYGVGVIYGIFVGLSLSARIGMRYTLILGMLVFSVGNVLCGAATGLVGLALARFVEGFGKMVAMAIWPRHALQAVRPHPAGGDRLLRRVRVFDAARHSAGQRLP